IFFYGEEAVTLITSRSRDVFGELITYGSVKSFPDSVFERRTDGDHLVIGMLILRSMELIDRVIVHVIQTESICFCDEIRCVSIIVNDVGRLARGVGQFRIWCKAAWVPASYIRS